jgi:hypothetical protein
MAPWTRGKKRNANAKQAANNAKAANIAKAVKIAKAANNNIMNKKTTLNELQHGVNFPFYGTNNKSVNNKAKTNCEDIPNDMSELLKYVQGKYITKDQYKNFGKEYEKKRTAMNYNLILIKAYELAFQKYSQMNNEAMHTLINKTIQNFVSDYSAIIGQPPCPLLDKTMSTGMLKGMGWRWAGQVPGAIRSALNPFPKG